MNTFCKMISPVLMAGAMVSGASAATYQGTFTAAIVDVFDNSPLSGTFVSVGPTGAPVFVERGPSLSGAFGKARAELGSNGFYSTSGAAGFSAWSDGFTLMGAGGGGGGSGDIDVSVSIHGTIIGQEADMSYGLYVSKTPFSIDSEAGLNDLNLSATLANASQVLSYAINNADKSPNTTLTGKLNVTFGETFYVLAYLYGDVCTPLEGPGHASCSGGSQDFYHSAVFGLTAQNAAQVSTLSGHTYAAAVPESGSLALAMVGLFTLLGAPAWRSVRSISSMGAALRAR
jgi:hypothetical protein